MIRSTKTLIPVVAAVAAVAAFWFLALAPKREEAKRIDGEITAKQSQLDQSKTQIASYEKAKENYRTNYRTLTRLGKAVPADDDVRSLLVQLNDAAKRSKVDFRAITIGGGGGGGGPTGGKTADGELAPAPGTVPVGSAGFSAMPFTFGFEGSFFKLSDFFNRLEDFVTVTNDDVDVSGRLLLLGNISITPDGGLKNMKAQIGATSYLVPPATGIEGATPEGPAAAPQGAVAPSGDQGVPPTTSATITGVR